MEQQRSQQQQNQQNQQKQQQRKQCENSSIDCSCCGGLMTAAEGVVNPQTTHAGNARIAGRGACVGSVLARDPLARFASSIRQRHPAW